MSTVFAYARVSTADQNTEMQVDAIKKAHPGAVIRTETASATSRNGRPVLELILDMIGQGDRLVVWKLDRLARNTLDLLQIVQTLEGKGAALEILDQRIDTSVASGKAFIQMLGVFAEFENNLRRERQMAGIAKAKTAGKYRGRGKSHDPQTIKAMLADGKTHAQVAKALGCSTKTIQRAKL